MAYVPTSSPTPRGIGYAFPAGVNVRPAALRTVDGTVEPRHTWEAQGRPCIGASIGPRQVSAHLSGGRD